MVKLASVSVSDFDRKVRFRSVYSSPSKSSVMVDFPPTLTKQEFKEDSDPNYIMEKFSRTGDMSLIVAPGKAPQFGDFVSTDSYHDSMNIVIHAQDEFASLPAKLRERFGNDPALLLDFLSDSANRDEAIKLGLISGDLSTPASPQEAIAGVENIPPATKVAGSASSSKKAVKEPVKEEE